MKRREFIKAGIGLGEIDEKSIEILGEKLSDLQVEWKPAQLKG